MATKTEGNARSEIKAIIASEKQFSAVVRAGGRDAPVADQNAAKAAIKERMDAMPVREGENQRFKMLQARSAVVTSMGDGVLTVSGTEIKDARALAADRKTVLTHASDVKNRDGSVKHTAGEVRQPSGASLFLSNNLGAIRDTKAGTVGLDALPKEPGKIAKVYIDLDKVVEAADKTKAPLKMLAALKESFAHSRVLSASLQIGSEIAAKRAKDADKGR